MISCITFIYLGCLSSIKTKYTDIDVPRVKTSSEKSKKLLSIVLICSTFFCYLVIVKAMVFFLATFTVDQLNWSTASGSYATTDYWAAFAIGRLTGIYITKRFKTKMILMVYITTLLVSSLGLMITTLLKMDTGVWIFVPMSG